MGLRLEVLERWSCDAAPDADDEDRPAVDEMLFALVEGRGAASCLPTLDSWRRSVAARGARDVVVRVRPTAADRIGVPGVGAGEAP